MTKQPFNINTILEEFDKKFGSPTSIPKYSVWNANALCNPKIVKQFLTDQIRKAMEEVKPKDFTSNNDDYNDGRGDYEDELNQNITNFFKE